MRTLVLTTILMAGLAPALASACPLGAKASAPAPQTVQDGAATGTAASGAKG